eukprot:SAG11_NODE_28412_length_322_cov_0.542601_1_plen_59_part_01
MLENLESCYNVANYRSKTHLLLTNTAGVQPSVVIMFLVRTSSTERPSVAATLSNIFSVT